MGAMQYISSIRVFDPITMAIFKDGNHYSINNNEANTLNNESLSNKDILYFSNILNKFKTNHNLELVYSDRFKYYFVAYIGISDDEFIYDDELNNLSEELNNYLRKNKIVFE